MREGPKILGFWCSGSWTLTLATRTVWRFFFVRVQALALGVWVSSLGLRSGVQGFGLSFYGCRGENVREPLFVICSTSTEPCDLCNEAVGDGIR